MRIAVFQGPLEGGDVARNLELLAVTARQAAESGARLLICPEMFLTGYAIGPAAVAALAEPVDGPSAARAAEIAPGRRVGAALRLSRSAATTGASTMRRCWSTGTGAGSPITARRTCSGRSIATPSRPARGRRPWPSWTGSGSAS